MPHLNWIGEPNTLTVVTRGVDREDKIHLTVMTRGYQVPVFNKTRNNTNGTKKGQEKHRTRRPLI